MRRTKGHCVHTESCLTTKPSPEVTDCGYIQTFSTVIEVDMEKREMECMMILSIEPFLNLH